MKIQFKSLLFAIVVSFALSGCGGAASSVAPAISAGPPVLDAKFLGLWERNYYQEITGNNWGHQDLVRVHADKITKVAYLAVHNIEQMNTLGHATLYEGAIDLKADITVVSANSFRVDPGVSAALDLQPEVPGGGHFGAGVYLFKGLYELEIAENGDLLMKLTEVDGNTEITRFVPGG